MPESVQGLTTIAGPSTPKPTSGSKTADKDLFLKLMVQQMSHQDPMNPTDGNEWLSQMVQFNSVEQLTNVAGSTANAASSAAMTQAVSLIGKTVSYTDAGNPVEGEVEKVVVGKDGPTLTIGGKD